MRGLHKSFPVLLAALVACPVVSLAGPRIYCCHDDQKRQVCSDTMPSTCVGKAYREIGDSGRTAKTVDAPPTAEQRAQRAAEEQQRREQERMVNEQRRKDQALLNTYSSEKDIELMRSRAERDLNMAIKAAEERITEIRKRRKGFENEAEFYPRRPLPADVAKGLRDADYEIRVQESVIDSKKKEQESMRAKYAEDLRRFVELSKRPARQ